MLIDDVRPTTLGGIKRLAKQIKKTDGVKYSDALERAAKVAGCENYPHAQRTLPAQKTAPFEPYVLLTIYWCDKDRDRQCGRETLRVELSRPLLEICEKHAFKYIRGFEELRMVADDHWVCDRIAHTQAYARGKLCKAERYLRFMEFTGLRPYRESLRPRPKALFDDKLPNTDHMSYWIDPSNMEFVLTDEPYKGAANTGRRAEWAVRNGCRIEKSSSAGMYWPYECDLYIAVDNSTDYDFDALMTKINAIPDPVISEEWPGDSSYSWLTYLSPLANMKQDIRRARCKGMIYPSDSRTTVPYNYDPGTTQRRPKGKLGVDGHIEVGSLIKAVMSSRFAPSGVRARMSSCRFELENWLCLELETGQLEGSEFYDVYYGWTDEDEMFQNALTSASDLVAALNNLKQKLKTAYPDCAPLRQQVQRIDMSTSMVKKARKAAQ